MVFMECGYELFKKLDERLGRSLQDEPERSIHV